MLYTSVQSILLIQLSTFLLVAVLHNSIIDVFSMHIQNDEWSCYRATGMQHWVVLGTVAHHLFWDKLHKCLCLDWPDFCQSCSSIRAACETVCYAKFIPSPVCKTYCYIEYEFYSTIAYQKLQHHQKHRFCNISTWSTLVVVLPKSWDLFCLTWTVTTGGLS